MLALLAQQTSTSPGNEALAVAITRGSIAMAVLFGLLGGYLAQRRGSNMFVGAALGLMCGVLGLFFVTRLPTNDGYSNSVARRRQREQMYGEMEPGEWTIAPEVAEKLGLPPQVPPSGPIVAPVGEPSPAMLPSVWSPSGAGGAAAPSPFGAPAAPPPPVGYWAPDPTGRYPERWWDGAAWTTRIRLDGVEYTDTGTPA